jgi:hypothetical protein
MKNAEKQKPSHPYDGSDNKPLDSQCVRRALRRISLVLRKHAEILAFYEAKNLKQKKSHDVLRIVGCNGKTFSKHKTKIRYDKNTKLS